MLLFPEQPIIFMSKSFFISFCKLRNQFFETMNLIDKKALIFLEELILERSTVYIDLPLQVLIESNLPDPVTYIKENNINADDEIFLVYFSKLIANGIPPKSCKTEMEDYRQRRFDLIINHTVRPTFLLTAFNNSAANEIQDQTGIICLSNNITQLNENIYKLYFAQIEQNGKKDPQDYFTNLPSSNNLVIEEPYLLKQSYLYIKNLIFAIIRNNLKISPCYITLVTQSGIGNLEYVKKLKNNFSEFVILEHYEKKYIHDRNIYTNSIWVSSDYGFMEKYSKSATKWVSYPLGVYYSDYLHRMKNSLKFLKNEKVKSNNYLTFLK